MIVPMGLAISEAKTMTNDTSGVLAPLELTDMDAKDAAFKIAGATMAILRLVPF